MPCPRLGATDTRGPRSQPCSTPAAKPLRNAMANWPSVHRGSSCGEPVCAARCRSWRQIFTDAPRYWCRFRLWSFGYRAQSRGRSSCPIPLPPMSVSSTCATPSCSQRAPRSPRRQARSGERWPSRRTCRPRPASADRWACLRTRSPRLPEHPARGTAWSTQSPW